MIETNVDCDRFKKENLEGDWIVHIIPVYDGLHPVDNRPSILFIRNISTGKTYYFAFHHPDSIPIVPHTWFVQEFLLNNKNIKWALNKKTFNQMLYLPNVYDINFASHLKYNEIFEEVNYETSAHFLVRKNSGNCRDKNLSIPLLKHKETFDDLADDVSRLIKDYECDCGFVRFNNIIIETLGVLEQQGIFVNRELFTQRFGIDPGPSNIVHSQYNVYTSTGRPSNRFDGINYSALNKEDGSRKCFQSRFRV